MRIDEILIKLRTDFDDYSFKEEYQGAGWARIFIAYKGVQVGRLNFSPGERIGRFKFWGIKHYKPEHIGYDYSKEDDFFHQFFKWLETGEKIEISYLVEIAKNNTKLKLAERKRWREENPKYDLEGKVKMRPRLKSNWMNEFRKLVAEETT